MRTSLHAAIALATSLGIASTSPALSQATPLSQATEQSKTRQPAIERTEQAALAEQRLRTLFERTGKRPNIVILMIDDMGWGEPGVYGGGELLGAATPNIDRLAREGLRLTSTYSQPTCTPTRSAMLTGRLPVRTGLTRPIVAGDRLTANPWADEISLAAILSEHGYHTMLCGKWHIGEIEGMRPFEVGFDEFYGFYPAQKELSQALDARRYPDLVLDPFKLDAYRKLGASEALVKGWKGGQEETVRPMESLEDIAEADRLLKEYTVARIADLAKGDEPFFLIHSFMKVHADNFPSAAFVGSSRSKFQYKDAVVEVDAYIGEIAKAVEAAGVAENTLIFITSDNGPQYDSWPDSGYTPFRGAKGSTWEGGVRVPGIAWWPGMIATGRTSDGLFDLMDLFNTSLHLGGAIDSLPTDRYIDGVDQTSFLVTDDGQSLRDKVFMWVDTTPMAIRMLEYKMHVKVVETSEKWLDIDMATMSTVAAPWMFNLYIDPKEEYPVGHRLNSWLAAMGAELKFHVATFKKFPPKDVGLGKGQ
jgi:arylsulfatase A-like enzyme